MQTPQNKGSFKASEELLEEDSQLLSADRGDGRGGEGGAGDQSRGVAQEAELAPFVGYLVTTNKCRFSGTKRKTCGKKSRATLSI